ncbi:MAG: nitrous oxide reductase accessory protein NosL, partial [Deltaproteobacteria bacterium]|nr:nitrous oxide reductase accessory protein NosL [Deltaproteobacteria bacterium]
ALCGMKVNEAKRQHFVVTTNDGKKQKACNEGCTVMLLENIKKDVKTLESVDYNTGKLIDAYKAFYVRGSDIKPVMGGQSIVAFSKREDAEKFQKEHGGKVETAEEMFKEEGHEH